jgi:hypothetical protein
MAGFTSGDGSFAVTENKSSFLRTQVQDSGHRVLDRRAKINVRIVFSVSQDSKDEHLIRSMVNFFGCGAYRPSSNRTTISFQSYRFSDNCEKIIPFFKQYNIRGVKSLDFQDWCKIAEIIRTKDHLTKEGFDLICQIKSSMNKGR